MNTELLGYWNKKKEKLKSKYPLINENDLNFPLGKEREMLEILGSKMGKTKLELLQIIISL